MAAIAGPTPPIGYVCARYPAISHTFVLREVRALRSLGLKVHPFAIRRALPEELLSDVDRDEDARTRALLPTTAGRVARALAALLGRPRGAAALAATARRALELRPPGLRGALWQGFYVAESVLLWHAARRLGIRHLHAHFANVASDVALLTATLGSAVEPQRPWTWSFTMHGSADFWNVEANRLPQKTEQATFVACISDFARSQLMAHGPSAGWDRLHVVHCGVHPGDYDRAPAPAGPHGPLRLVTVGRLVPVKGQALLVDVAERLRARGIDAEVTIVGDGPERGALEAAIREHDLEERVRLTGAVGQDRVPGYLARSDVFVLPSFAEGVPVSAMEAMAAGLPVVASRVTGVPELIRDGVNGRLVTVARVEELVDAVAELARDPDLRRRLGEAARATVAEEFDVVREAARLRELFARYAAGP